MRIKEELAKLDPGRKDLRQFALVLGGALLAFAALAWFKGSPALPWLGGLGGTIVLLGLSVPGILRQLYFVWMAIGLTLGRIVTAVILTVVFLIAVTPIGLIMKLVGKDPMHRHPDPDATTYWIPRDPKPHDKARYLKYF